MHTPGPWETSVLSDGTQLEVCAAGGGDFIAAAENAHDARLIAAAPAMLQALLDALPYVEDVLSDPAALACFKPGTVKRHAKAIRAAIAAATED